MIFLRICTGAGDQRRQPLLVRLCRAGQLYQHKALVRHPRQNIAVAGVLLQQCRNITQKFIGLLAAAQPPQLVGIHIEIAELIEDTVFIEDKLHVIPRQIFRVADSGHLVSLDALLGFSQHLSIAAHQQNHRRSQRRGCQPQTGQRPVKGVRGRVLYGSVHSDTAERLLAHAGKVALKLALERLGRHVADIYLIGALLSLPDGIEHCHRLAVGRRFVGLGITGQDIHLSVFCKLCPLILGSPLVIDHLIGALLGKLAQQLGDHPLIDSGVLIIVLQWIGIGVPGHIDDLFFFHFALPHKPIPAQAASCAGTAAHVSPALLLRL